MPSFEWQERHEARLWAKLQRRLTHPRAPWAPLDQQATYMRAPIKMQLSSHLHEHRFGHWEQREMIYHEHY
eukprot:6194109-Pleurochrysis_carterae.AAC.1